MLAGMTQVYKHDGIQHDAMPCNTVTAQPGIITSQRNCVGCGQLSVLRSGQLHVPKGPSAPQCEAQVRLKRGSVAVVSAAVMCGCQ